ncbi:methyltransferase [Pseudoalteromonas maricaloris]|uniref:methyltransferase n=1 Tax=Pseudoalteromonas maricaloris TaxID=184924 RepID=UPI00029A5D87|nr:methyltransferase [Pseudoalteromonas flavipulchra]
MKELYSLEEYDKHLYGYVVTELLALCFKYNIFERLVQAPGTNIGQLAQELNLAPEALLRMLLTLNALDILTERGDGFAVEDYYLPFFDKTHIRYLGNFTQFVCDQGRKSIFKLENLLTGEEKPRSPYDDIYSQDKSYSFAAAMWELSHCSGQPLISFLPDALGDVVDVGGGAGAVASMLIAANKAQSVTVFDLPEVASEFDRYCNDNPLFHRIRFKAGSFFEDSIPNGNNYLLSNVLSNWNENSSVAILTKIHAQLAARNGGKVFILERLFDVAGSRYSTAVMHLNMMLHTEGAHRSFEQYKSLLHQAGFSCVELIETGTDRHIVTGSL